ncbi:CaiB/BaiF CoA-transferase family protein [Rufibacter sp. LB8]|uniref:CaiB/BaiF CoA transferase family protein n=1 Tax=Rufibacter sp. LB8 TaxID=2777781 RepID=UPI00178C6556|nr:CaiB/BaiF CoA-transferase family protein [Rufibacter sp. LB8]
MSPKTENEPLLAGVLVVELASVLAGPSVGQFLAELGATVLKVENLKTQGDVTRSWKPSTEDPAAQVSAYFSAANWGKQSLCVDLKDANVQQALQTIIQKADIVLASFKPGDAEKLHMDYATLAKGNERLLYGQITGYGNDVPRAGYDAVLQAEAGFMFLNGEKDGQPLKMPVALIDLLAAHQLKEGLLAALYHRERTGKGQKIEVSLVQAAISSLANQATNYLVAGVAPQRMGSEHPNIVPYGTVFTTQDQKELVLAIGDDRQFRDLCQILQQPDLGTNLLFATNRARVVNREVLNRQLSDLISKINREDLLQACIAQNVPAGAVHSIPEALAQPAAQAQLLAEPGQNPKGLRQMAFQGMGLEPAVMSPPPALGHHTWQILQERAGLTVEQLEELAAAGVVSGQGGGQKE